MMHIAVSGATGYIGRFIVNRLLQNDATSVTIIGRNPPPENIFSGKAGFINFSLDDKTVPSDLFRGIDAFIHAAFSHKPGQYRGGEGDDPEGFRKRNLDGSIRLFKAAKQAGTKRAVFLSSRAVYGAQPPGMKLAETTPPAPDTLYGRIKLETEKRLAELSGPDFLPVSLRATGVYGALEKNAPHKWSELFARFNDGQMIAPRIGTEVHGEDLAAAAEMLLRLKADDLVSTLDNKMAVFNVSDILLDRHDLLNAYAQVTGTSVTSRSLPPKSDASTYNQMDCTRLHKLGWQPRGKLDLSWLANNKNRAI